MFKRNILTLWLIMILFIVGCTGNPNDTTSQPDRTHTSGELVVHFIDVGQAESIFIQLPNSQSMLIDAGKNSSGDLVVDYLKQHKIKKIDYLVGTHPHEDHIGGIDDVIKKIEIGKFYMPKVSHTTKTFRNVIAAAQAKKLNIRPAKAGVEIVNQPGLKIDILAPLRDEYEALNNYSAVIKLTYGDRSWLFTGDAEALSEQDLLQHNANLKADVLNVGHHGSVTSTTDEFLQEVAPRLAVISAGKDNDYGHPHQEVLKRLQEAGIDIYRTDSQGTIVITDDGTNIETKTLRGIDALGLDGADSYVGSVNSNKYHLPDCSHVTSISSKNLIRFNGLDDAHQAGYQPCSNIEP